MARLKLISILVFTLAANMASADVAFKYKLKPFFGLKEACIDNGEKELSQVRFTVNKTELKSNLDFIEAEIRLSACVITGGIIKERYSLPVPRFLFAEAAPMQGVFKVDHPKFSKVSVDEIKQGSFQIRFIEKSGKAWKQIDPIELTLNKKGEYPDKIRFYVTSKKKWIEAKLRLIEGL